MQPEVKELDEDRFSSHYKMKTTASGWLWGKPEGSADRRQYGADDQKRFSKSQECFLQFCQEENKPAEITLCQEEASEPQLET